jgi:hypothetical protein
MKIRMCSFAAMVSMALSNAVFAAEHDVLEHHLRHEKPITGTVVEFGDMLLTIQDSKKERLTFNVRYFDQPYQPKAGDKVMVHYYLGRHGVWITDKVEKLGNPEKGS